MTLEQTACEGKPEITETVIVELVLYPACDYSRLVCSGLIMKYCCLFVQLHFQ